MKTKDKIQIEEELTKRSEEPVHKRVNGLPAGLTKTTLVLQQKHLLALKTVAICKNTTLRNLMEKIIHEYLSSKEISVMLSKLDFSKLQND